MSFFVFSELSLKGLSMDLSIHTHIYIDIYKNALKDLCAIPLFQCATCRYSSITTVINLRK